MSWLIFTFIVFLIGCALTVKSLSENREAENSSRNKHKQQPSNTQATSIMDALYPNYKRDLETLNGLINCIEDCNTLYEVADAVERAYVYANALKDVIRVQLKTEDGYPMEYELAQIILAKAKKITLKEIKLMYNYREPLRDKLMAEIIDTYTFLMFSEVNTAIDNYNKAKDLDEDKAIHYLEQALSLYPPYLAIYDILKPYYESRGSISKVVQLLCIKQKSFKADNIRIAASFIEKNIYFSALVPGYLYREESLPNDSYGNKTPFHPTKLDGMSDVLDIVESTYVHNFMYFCELSKKKVKLPSYVKVESNGPKKELPIEVKGGTKEEMIYSQLATKYLRFRASRSYLIGDYNNNKCSYNNIINTCVGYIDRADTLDVLKKLYACLMYCCTWFNERHMRFVVKKIESDIADYLRYRTNDIYKMLNKNLIRLADEKYQNYKKVIKTTSSSKDQDRLSVEMFSFLENIELEIRNLDIDKYKRQLLLIRNSVEDTYSEL